MIRAYGMKRLREMQAKSKKPADSDKPDEPKPAAAPVGEQTQAVIAQLDAQPTTPSQPHELPKEATAADEKAESHVHASALPGPSASATCDSIATQVTLVPDDADAHEPEPKPELQAESRQAAVAQVRAAREASLASASASASASAHSELLSSPSSSSTNYMHSIERRSEVRPNSDS